MEMVRPGDAIGVYNSLLSLYLPSVSSSNLLSLPKIQDHGDQLPTVNFSNIGHITLDRSLYPPQDLYYILIHLHLSCHHVFLLPSLRLSSIKPLSSFALQSTFTVIAR